MEFSARVVGRGRPPPGERLFLHDMDLTGEDFSGRKLGQLSAAGSTFTRCRFERMKVDDATLGITGSPCRYVECSFDGSRMFLPGSSDARFERCSFRNIDFRRWGSSCLELIDCVFTGKLRETVFHGSVLWERDRESCGRERNEFHGNDFSGLKVFDVAFRSGIDLTRQRLPTGEDFVYLPQAAETIARVRAQVAGWPASEERELAESVLDSIEKKTANGQRQLLLRPSNYSRYGWRHVAPEVFRLLREAAS